MVMSSTALWGVFFAFVAGLLALDLGVFSRKDGEMTIKQSIVFSSFYLGIGILFGFWVWFTLGIEKASLFWTAMIVEKSLSLDNIFVISVIFGYFTVAKSFQHRVLFWGIIGVLILRGLLIAVGTVAIQQFEWLLYIFGGFLVYTGVKMLFSDDDDAPEIAENPVLKKLRQYIPVTERFVGNKFFVKQKDEKSGVMKWFATPLFFTLVIVECMDLVFALDSVPAVLSITQDTYIVYTSNIFAILGLRALYFLLLAMLNRFEYLKYAISLVLVFIGLKIFINKFFHIPAEASLAITLGLLASGVVYSMVKTKAGEAEEGT